LGAKARTLPAMGCGSSGRRVRSDNAVPQPGRVPAGTSLLVARPFGQRVRRKPAVGEGLAERLPQKVPSLRSFV